MFTTFNLSRSSSYRPPTNTGRKCFQSCLFVHRGWVPCDNYPWRIGPHCTALPSPKPWPTQTQDFIVQGPPASDIWWQSLETCSNLYNSGHPLQSWHLMAIEGHMFDASWRYASYWNVFLFSSFRYLSPTNEVCMRRLCFHRCLSIHRGRGLGICPRGVSVHGDLCPGRSLSIGGSLSRWDLCPGGLCPGKGLCSGGVSVQGGFLSRGSLFGGSLFGGMLSKGRSLSSGVSVQGRGVSVQGRGVSVQGRGVSVQGRGVSVQGRGVSVQGRGVSVQGRGVSVQGVSVQSGLCPGGSLSTGVSVLGGSLPGGSLSRRSPPPPPTVRSGRDASYWNASLIFS